MSISVPVKIVSTQDNSVEDNPFASNFQNTPLIKNNSTLIATVPNFILKVLTWRPSTTTEANLLK